MGNASFATLRDASGDIQIYVTKNNVEESVYEDFKTWTGFYWLEVFQEELFMRVKK